MTKLEKLRNATRNRILNNPFKVERLRQQPYVYDSSYGLVEDGDIIDVMPFKKQVRIIEREEGEESKTSRGVVIPVIKRYLLCEHDESVVYGLIFEYYGKVFKTKQPVPTIKAGGIVSIYTELEDITEGSVYA